jgi:DNA polymerase-3 subunit alpha
VTWNVAENELESGALSQDWFGSGTFKAVVPVGITTAHARTAVRLGDEWRVHPTDELISRLRSLFGATAVDIRYR